MKFLPFPLFLSSLALICPLAAQQPPPESALKYHEALLKRPQNSTLLDRFFGAWIDEQPIETLDAFLKDRAEKHGGQDLAILAQHQLRRGQEDEALQTLAKAIVALPDEVYLPMERAKIQLRRLDFEAARADLEKVTQGKDPQLALEATKLIGKSWLREGDPKKAIETWDKLLAANPSDEDLLEDLVESAAAEGEIDQALTYAQKLINVSSDPYKKTLRQLRQGDLLAQAGRNDDAVKNYSETLAQVGEGSWLEREILAQIDKTFRKQDRLNDLKTAFIQLAEANPRRLLIHRQLAKLEADQGDVDSAVGRFREVLKRSPGNNELREEFIRLLTDTEKFEDASEEINKLITQAPDNTSLLLQLADIQHRQNNKEAAAATLEKALKLFGPDENSGIRIASLMLQYGLDARGEEILKSLTTSPNATTAPAEALASQYARTNRKPEAIAIFKKIAEDPNIDVILRAAGAISALGEAATSYDLLSQKIQAHDQDLRFLAALTQAALASEKKEEAIKHAIRLVRISKQTADVAQSIELAMRAITAADQVAQWSEALEKQEAKSPAEICLYAALVESSADFDKVEKLMAENTDPTVIRFHCILLERRGEWNEAITVLKRLADTDEGRKASFFKDLSELQRNAGLTEDALATIERWKQSAPTDRTAWIVGSSILRDEAKTDEAIKMIRQAASRFKDDTDLTANLAQLHEEAGQFAEAQSIYWQLYDNSEKPADQARWATNLAEIATQTGRTQELEEQLRERSRNNRRSIGPLLAQAELARLTRDDDKRRDLLLEAVRLQPNNIDLRLQIANLEEQSGNPDRVIAILEEAVATDTTGRIRNSLAQAYLRQGQILKGMRELQKLAGNQAKDPRVIETNATSLASSGLYDEAIRYLREALPDGGDWRTKYLLAIMLEQDGRESEAIPLFQSLLQTSEEIPSLAPIKKPGNQREDEEEYWSQYPQSMRDIMDLMEVSQAAYLHRNPDRNSYGSYFSSSNSGMSQLGTFVLPNESKVLRSLVQIHLAKIHPKGIENAGFISDLMNAGNPYQTNFGELLKKYPDYPGLFELALAYSSWNEENSIDKQVLRHQLDNNKNLSKSSRLQIYLHFIRDAEPNDPMWKELIKISEEISKSEKPTEALQLGYMLMQMFYSNDENVIKTSEETKKSISKLILDIATRDLSKHDPMGNFKLFAVNCAGTQEQWIQTVNETIKAHQADKKSQQPTSLNASIYGHQYGYGGPNSGMPSMSPFILPQLTSLSLRCLPTEVLGMIQPQNSEMNYFGFNIPEPKSLLPNLDKFESPTLRLWIALRAEDQAAIDKHVAATPPENELADFNTLKAFQAVFKKDHANAYKLFSELRPTYSSDRNLIKWLNLTLIAIANEMKPEERASLTEELRALLIQCRSSLGLQAGPALAAQAEKFGMTDLSKRFAPQAVNKINTGVGGLGPAAFGILPSQSSSSGGNASIEKMKKFASEGKTEAAALEALNLIRKASKSSYNRSYEIRQIKEEITPEVLTELLKLSDPGESTSLTKLLEYADICNDFGKRDTALQVLSKLQKERPDDLNIASKLAFLLPPDQQELAVQLLNKSAAKDEFIMLALANAEFLSDSEDETAAFNFFSTIAAWLQKTDPKTLESVNLSWVAYHALGFFDGDFNREIPELTEEKPQGYKDNKNYTEYINIAKRLATAMLRHPSTAEEGFRLLGSSHAWKINEAERDEQARQVFLTSKVSNKIRGVSFGGSPDASYFSIRTSQYSSNASDDLDKFSSAKWVSERIAAAKSPDEVLSSEYLKQLSASDPVVGELISALVKLKTIKELETYWKSDSLKNASGPFAAMCRSAILSRARHIPESANFFLDRINEVSQKSIEQARYESNNNVTSLFSAAILTAANQKNQAVLDKTCTVISKKIFGDKINFDDQAEGMKLYGAIDFLENILSEMELEPASMIRLQSTFYKLGIPAGQYEHQVAQAFNDISIKNVGEAEKLLASFGWLNDIETWEPFSIIVIDADHIGGNQIKFNRKEMFMMPQAIEYFDMNISSEDVAKHLQNLKPQTFGNLITAACFADGNERQRLAAEAFNLSAAKLAKMPPERAKAFTPLLPFLTEAAIAKLPENFQNAFGNSKSEKLAKLQQAADEYLKSQPNPNRYGGSPFYEIRELVMELARVDRDKALAVFLEADRRFSEALARGQRVSSYTSNDLQIIERDDTMEDIVLRSSNSQKLDPVASLAFHQLIAAHPSASRFSFATDDDNTPILFYIGQNIYDTERETKKTTQTMLQLLRGIDALPANLKNDAYFAIGTYYIGNPGRRNEVQIKKDRTELDQAKDLNEVARHIRAAHIGVSKWTEDDNAGRLLTRNAITSLANMQDVAPTTRFQFLFVCSFMMPNIMNDTEIAEAITKSFEDYASKDRSVINNMGLYMQILISRIPPSDQLAPYLARINKAFWGNINSAKAGGHPNVPPNMTSALLISTVVAKDEESVTRLINSAKPHVSGDANLIFRLIESGNFNHAKQLFCPPNKFHPLPKGMPNYTSDFEKKFNEFRKDPSINPISLLRFDTILLDICPLATGPQAPSESRANWENRLITTYLASPPKELNLRVELVSRLIRDSNTAAVALKDEVLDIRNQLNLKKSLDDWGKGSGNPTDPFPRYQIAPAECAIIRQAAFLDLLEGNASPLAQLVETVIIQPANVNTGRYGSYNYNREFTARVTSSMPAWIIEAVSRDKTTGFKDAYAPLAKLALHMDSVRNFGSPEIQRVITMAEFLAFWTGEPQTFEETRKQIKNYANSFKQLDQRRGLTNFLNFAKEHKGWSRESFAEPRQQFLIKVFTKPEMAPYLGTSVDLISQTANSANLKEDLIKIAANPPANLTPPATHHLLKYYAEMEFNAKRFDTGLAAITKAIEVCPAEGPWKEVHFRTSIATVERLINAKQLDMAKKVHEMIKLDTLNPHQTKRYEENAKKLAPPAN